MYVHANLSTIRHQKVNLYQCYFTRLNRNSRVGKYVFSPWMFDCSATDSLIRYSREYAPKLETMVFALTRDNVNLVVIVRKRKCMIKARKKKTDHILRSPFPLVAINVFTHSVHFMSVPFGVFLQARGEWVNSCPNTVSLVFFLLGWRRKMYILICWENLKLSSSPAGFRNSFLFARFGKKTQ